MILYPQTKLFQNAADRRLTKLRIYVRIFEYIYNIIIYPKLYHLYVSYLKFHINYKVLLLTYNGLAPVFNQSHSIRSQNS